MNNDSENKNGQDENALYGYATEELEEEIPKNNKRESEIVARKLENEERELRRKDKRFTKAMFMFIFCLSVLCGVVAVDIALTAFSVPVSKTIDTFIEILKALLFTISGFLFATHWNEK